MHAPAGDSRAGDARTRPAARGAAAAGPGDASPAARRYEVRDSGIHGQGLFATAAIDADRLIGEAVGTATRRNGVHVLWYRDERGVERALRIRNELRFANHARPGNAAFHGTELWSLVPIAAGEEITVDYGPGW